MIRTCVAPEFLQQNDQNDLVFPPISRLQSRGSPQFGSQHQLMIRPRSCPFLPMESEHGHHIRAANQPTPGSLHAEAPEKLCQELPLR